MIIRPGRFVIAGEIDRAVHSDEIGRDVTGKSGSRDVIKLH